MKRKIFIIILAVLSAFAVSADGDETVDLLKSPDIMASGGSYTSTLSPMSDIYNPAASALQQRLAFNINYIALFGDNTLSGYNGTALNLGAAIPLRIGVITAGGYFLGTDSLDEIDAGVQGGFRTGFAKELYPGLLTGIGINLGFGESWALSADLGFIKEEGDLGFIKDMKWGVVLGELGYSGFNTTDYSSVFTPGGGISFDLLDKEKINFGVNADLSFPGFIESMNLNLGGDLELFDVIGLQFSSRMDLSELIEGDPSGLVPSLGVYVNLKTNFEDDDLSKRGWSQNDVRTSVSAAPMRNGLWAVGAGINAELGVIDESAPEIMLDLSEFFGEVKTDGIESDDQEADDDGTDDDGTDDDGTDDDGVKEVSLKSGKSLKTIRNVAEGNKKNNDKKYISYSEYNPGNMDEGPDGERIVTYISPNNDGIKDFVEIPVSITDTRYIKGFSFIIEDEEGNEIKKIENKEKRPENAGFLNFFKRIFYVEKGVDIPETIRWEGIGDDGEVAEDGFYRFYMQAWDDNGNISETEKYGLVVDNTAPAAELVGLDAEEKIFSPNNDGLKDQLPIEQYGSLEDKWVAVIKSADGRVYKNYSWQNGSPDSFVWDGKDDRKLLVPDGVYFYYLESSDRAGNSFETEIANIIINTQTTPIALDVDASYFAPGASEGTTSVSFRPDVPVKTGIRSWSLSVVDSSGSTVKKYEDGEIPDSIVYRGEKGNGYISEGRYKGILDIKYINGNNPVVESPVIVADTTPPEASAKVSLRVFSPNGDGKKDVINIYQETSTEDVWYAEITGSGGNVVRSYKWVQNAESSFSWDGYAEDGSLAEDGSYYYRLYTEDRAGNSVISEPVSFELDTEETPVILTAAPEAFSPNGDRVNDVLNLTPILNVKDGIQSYKLVISSTDGKVVKTIASEGRIKNKFVWDGVTEAGRKADDGTYRAAIEVVYEKGNISNAVTRDFILDTSFPVIDADIDLTLFSPDEDGLKDQIVISQKTSEEELISALIKDETGKVVRAYNWEGSAGNIIWDGTDENGNKVDDGIYSYLVSAEDKSGNRTEKTIDRIEVDNRQTTVFITASSKGFTPDGDGSNDRMEFATMATLKEGVESWKVVIKKNGSQTVKTFSGDILPEKIIWDGKSDEGIVIEGEFSAEYSVKYLKGNEPESITKEFSIDISAPTAVVTAAPRPFSPDNDGVDDEIAISIDVSDASKISDWKFDIVDRQGNEFTSFGGKGEPAQEIIWDGIGKSGALVIAAEDYPYRLTVTDEFGNTATEYGIIPVDVLVVKEGNQLKIRIASITFAPDSAELRRDDAEIKAKNEYVLGRLAEILEKYDSYNILIEGHAVSVYWSDAERAEREQQEELLPLSKARAETVKNYLEQLGVAGRRMSTEGIGGENPVVPHSDLENRWKNRRVEFILLK
ncbi:MAG: gliding motility-associated C-terminal domain-containing protein [Spirochaetales bacterium]|uniref:Gliding motility-associated C-terminal domain-containing protein n=1 Tax=Candidatus Thalassospirochaeta sargassi TaxID=3119039 RepID=A0AAJ1IEA5_9SPIO|nr:gliding motility-associated C-terminal domain-containing protein [Spirochaetales bacterium]